MSSTANKRISLRDPIWQFNSLIVTIIATFISLYSVYDVYNRSIPRRNIAVISTQVTELISSSNISNIDVKVLYQNIPVKSASIFVFTISNIGNMPLAEADQVRPITFSFPSSTKVITATIISEQPSTIDPKLIIIDQSRVVIEPLLLNSGDVFNFEIVAINIEGNNILIPSVDGRIVGIKEVIITSLSDQEGFLMGLRSAYNTEAMIVIPVTVVIISVLLWFFPVFWDTIQQIFGHRPNTFWGKFSLNLAIATLIATVFEDIAEGLLKVIQRLI